MPISLNQTDRKLEAFLQAGETAIASVFFRRLLRRQNLPIQEIPDVTFTALSGTTETTICAAPTENGQVIIVDEIYIHNDDSEAILANVVIDDNTTNRTLIIKSLEIDQTLFYSGIRAQWDIV